MLAAKGSGLIRALLSRVRTLATNQRQRSVTIAKALGILTVVAMVCSALLGLSVNCVVEGGRVGYGQWL
eukprot:12626023-Alexandrium_andersonii.AAC.1